MNFIEWKLDDYVNFWTRVCHALDVRYNVGSVYVATLFVCVYSFFVSLVGYVALFSDVLAVWQILVVSIANVVLTLMVHAFVWLFLRVWQKSLLRPNANSPQYFLHILGVVIFIELYVLAYGHKYDEISKVVGSSISGLSIVSSYILGFAIVCVERLDPHEKAKRRHKLKLEAGSRAVSPNTGGV